MEAGNEIPGRFQSCGLSDRRGRWIGDNTQLQKEGPGIGFHGKLRTSSWRPERQVQRRGLVGAGLKAGPPGAGPAAAAAGGVRSFAPQRAAGAAELEPEPQPEPVAESESGVGLERAPSTWGPQTPS